MASIQLAAQAFSQGRIRDCEQLCQALLKANPANVSAIDLLSHCAAAQRDFGKAILLCTRLIALAKGHPHLQAMAYARVGGYQRMLGSTDAAEKAYRQALVIEPAYPTHRALLLTFLYDHVQIAPAREQIAPFLQCLVDCEESVPENEIHQIGLALYLVSQLVQKEGLSACLEQVLKIAAHPGLPRLRTEASLEYALGSLQDRLGNPVDALNHFRKANEARRAKSGYKVEPVLEQVRTIAGMFDEAFFLNGVSARVQEGDPRVVFIVGMPRSGTSLIEQVFAAHSKVFPIGESYRLSQSLAAVLKQRPECQPHIPPSLDEDFFTAIRRSYLDGLKPGEGESIITDKMPANLMYAWVIRKAFPDGRIIVSERDKLSTVMSCFTTNFADRNCFGEKLSDCGRYYDAMYSAATHWEAVLGDMLLRQDYEALVAAPEKHIELLLSHAGLPYESACLEPHKSRRVVQTASRLQVTQPIYRTGNERWQAYRDLLGDDRRYVENPDA